MCWHIPAEHRRSGTGNYYEEAIEERISSITDKLPVKDCKVIKVETIHHSKKFWGRVGDWVKWKTPLRRVFYKPYFVELTVADLLRDYQEHSTLLESISDEDMEIILKPLENISIWEKRWPDNPYAVVTVDMHIVPHMPAKYINITLTREK